MPREVGNILLELAGNKHKAIAVAEAMGDNIDNFNKLPYEVRNMLLLKLSDITSTDDDIEGKMAAGWQAVDVAFYIAMNFDKLSESVQKLLFKLANNEETAFAVADAVVDQSDKLPQNVRNELQKTLEKNGYVFK
jgi:uncharacterized protein YbaP (TraB family)